MGVGGSGVAQTPSPPTVQSEEEAGLIPLDRNNTEPRELAEEEKAPLSRVEMREMGNLLRQQVVREQRLR